MKISFLSGSLLWLSVAQLVWAGAYDELTPQQQKEIQNGKQVFITRDVPGQPWPKAFVYQRVDADPEESASVLSDYSLQKEYVKNLKKSEISRRINPATVWVDYTIKLPLWFGEENYTLEEHLGSYDQGKSFRVDWKQVRADSVKNGEGNARFETLGTGTLMAYYTFVIPTWDFSGWVQDQAMSEVKNTVKSIAERIQKERQENQDLLKKQVQQLRVALGIR